MDSEVTAPTSPKGSVNINLAITWMLLGVFAVGTVEYLVAGVLPQISREVAVTEATAGLLVTVYALTVVIGGPLLTIITSRVKRIPLVLALMTLFIEAYSQTAWRPVKPLARAHLRKAVNKTHCRQFPYRLGAKFPAACHSENNDSTSPRYILRPLFGSRNDPRRSQLSR